jgi:hypothetical protein
VSILADHVETRDFVALVDRVVRCDVCAYADEHGSWADVIPGLTHCRRCCGSWPQASELQHCVGCCRTFTNVAAAELHCRYPDPEGPKTCRDPATIVDRQGRPKLVVSTRVWRTGTTVTVWTRPSRTGWPETGRVADSSASAPGNGS